MRRNSLGQFIAKQPRQRSAIDNYISKSERIIEINDDIDHELTAVKVGLGISLFSLLLCILSYHLSIMISLLMFAGFFLGAILISASFVNFLEYKKSLQRALRAADRLALKVADCDEEYVRLESGDEA